MNMEAKVTQTERYLQNVLHTVVDLRFTGGSVALAGLLFGLSLGSLALPTSNLSMETRIAWAIIMGLMLLLSLWRLWHLLRRLERATFWVDLEPKAPGHPCR